MKFTTYLMLPLCLLQGLSLNGLMSGTMALGDMTGGSFDSSVVVALLEDRAFATEFFIIADLDVKTGPELAASAAKTEHAMCPRCRRYEPAAEGGDVCERCAEVLS